jgi:hypothetical protein
VQYLTRWKGHGPEWDTWYDEADLDNAQDLIRDYEEGQVAKEEPEKAFIIQLPVSGITVGGSFLSCFLSRLFDVVLLLTREGKKERRPTLIIYNGRTKEQTQNLPVTSSVRTQYHPTSTSPRKKHPAPPARLYPPSPSPSLSSVSTSFTILHLPPDATQHLSHAVVAPRAARCCVWPPSFVGKPWATSVRT